MLQSAIAGLRSWVAERQKSCSVSNGKPQDCYNSAYTVIISLVAVINLLYSMALWHS